MRAVSLLSATFVGSVLLGACCWFAAGHVTGADPGLEGLLGLAMLISAIAFLSSGVLLFLMIGPAVLEQSLRQNGN